MGGTRFVGKAIVSKLINRGYDLTVFTRGNNKHPENVTHIKGDRNSKDIEQLIGMKFDLVIDSSGRTAEQTKKVLEIIGRPSHRFVYISSAGVYKDINQFPLDEDSPVDIKSRHIGKAETEQWLKSSNTPFTSFRPTYIYGQGNYNSIERWFFDRITKSRPIPLPGDGNTITQLGHVNDLAEAICLSIENEKSTNTIYNCSGLKGITFNGLIECAAIACGRDPDSIELATFDPSRMNSKERKIFPLRLNHYLTDISLITSHLNWQPKFDLVKGLIDSYKNDYALNLQPEPDFSNDIKLIGY